MMIGWKLQAHFGHKKNKNDSFSLLNLSQRKLMIPINNMYMLINLHKWKNGAREYEMSRTKTINRFWICLISFYDRNDYKKK